MRKKTKIDLTFISKKFLEEEIYHNNKSHKDVFKQLNLTCSFSTFNQYINSLGIRNKYRERAKLLIGKKFNYLTVKDIILRKDLPNNRRIWLICTCDCGEETSVEKYRINTTLSCGCKSVSKQKNKNNPCWRGYGEISSTRFTFIKSNAKQRNIEFNITIEYLWELFIKQQRKCAITGLQLIFSETTQNKECKNTTASLDRIDSSKGYTTDNVQWIHKDVNKMKWDFNQTYFIDMCKVICKNNGGCKCGGK